jgi:putative endonuclease
MDPAYVYIMASRRNGTFYTGSAVDLPKRAWEHRNGILPGFTRDYGVTMLVWYAGFPSRAEARVFEYRLKRWRRAWKVRLIEEMNPGWRDLYEDLAR